MAETVTHPVADGTQVVGGSYRVPGRRQIEQKYLEAAVLQMPGETAKAVFRGKIGMALWWLVVPPFVPFLDPLRAYDQSAAGCRF